MTPENFIYWLQGKLEIGDTKTLNEQEVQVIKDHIALVLKKETPNRIGPIVIKEDPRIAPGQIHIQPTLPATQDIIIRCKNGLLGGPCGSLTCSICNRGPLIATC